MTNALMQEYRLAVEQFCGLMTGTSITNARSLDEYDQKIRAAQERCDQARGALYRAGLINR
jgi:hypothetical protein